MDAPKFHRSDTQGDRHQNTREVSPTFELPLSSEQRELSKEFTNEFSKELLFGLDGEILQEIRDDRWLTNRVRLLRENHFGDVPQGYPIITQFSTRAKYRLGCIAARDGKALIQVNRLYADPFVPTYVVDGTLAHELAHYAHGFGSGLPRLYEHAHRGGVVDKELEKRGLGPLYLRAEQWRKAHWDSFYQSRCSDLIARQSAQSEDVAARWNTFLLTPSRRPLSEVQASHARLATLLAQHTPRMPLFTIEWLHATTRQNFPSYWYAQSRILRLHGLLSDRRVPDEILDFEIAYWLCRQAVGEPWQRIHALLCKSNLDTSAANALAWRKKNWKTFCSRYHPLK